jgi:hypothetical protein
MLGVQDISQHRHGLKGRHHRPTTQRHRVKYGSQCSDSCLEVQVPLLSAPPFHGGQQPRWRRTTASTGDPLPLKSVSPYCSRKEHRSGSPLTTEMGGSPSDATVAEDRTSRQAVMSCSLTPRHRSIEQMSKGSTQFPKSKPMNLRSRPAARLPTERPDRSVASLGPQLGI